jgi:tRNA threonylcarbamoyladenosine biosynthesis protein TsaE
MENTSQEITVTNTKMLADIAVDIANNLVVGSVLLLTGDLGTGKTTFTQLLAKALGVTVPVTSPTFTIAQEYEVLGHDDVEWLVHLDLYRISAGHEGVDLEYISEMIDTAIEHRRVVVVEWPEKVSLEVPNPWKISFAHGITESERSIIIKPPKP